MKDMYKIEHKYQKIQSQHQKHIEKSVDLEIIMDWKRSMKDKSMDSITLVSRGWEEKTN